MRFRLLLIPVVILASGLSFAWWLIATAHIDQRDRERLKHAWGWDTPTVNIAWMRLFDGNLTGHDLINPATEYTRQDPQRAQKFYSFIILCLLCLSGFLLFL